MTFPKVLQGDLKKTGRALEDFLRDRPRCAAAAKRGVGVYMITDMAHN